MSPLFSVALGAVFIALAFLMRGQARNGKLGFIMMMLAGVTWFVAAALGFWNE